MDIVDFLAKVLPKDGIYFVEVPRPGGGFAHHQCDSIAEMVQKITWLNTGDATVYFATSSFRQPYLEGPDEKDSSKTRRRYRVQDNVKWVRSFWLDLDVGATEEGKPAKYGSQAEACSGLLTFLGQTGLQAPMVVSSGYGVHCYWPMEEQIAPGQWRATAERLKRLCAHFGLRTDPARTADSASVLRPIGTFNRKGGGAVPVSLIRDGDVGRYTIFDDTLAGLEKKFGIKDKPVVDPIIRKLNEQFAISRPSPPSDANLVADGCAQLRVIRDTRGCVPEPVWYAGLQVLRHTTGGMEICHAWSNGYEGYSAAETDRKLDQLSGMGPTTCSTFEGRNPGGCKNCPFKGRITSPIQLGVSVRQAPAPAVAHDPGLPINSQDMPAPPRPFLRGGDAAPGLFIKIDQDIPVKFYDYDLFPTKIIYDEQVGFEQVNIRHVRALDGWQDFLCPSSVLGDSKLFIKAMRENGVQPFLDEKLGRIMQMFVDSYVRTLRERSRSQKLFTSFGWKDDGKTFVLGDRAFHADGRESTAGASKQISSNVTKTFHCAGDFAKWFELTKEIAQPGQEPHAFALCTAFGGPLMQLTNYSGLIVAMYGETNTGKTTAARLMSSVYGTQKSTLVSANSTELASTGILSTFGSLTTYLDELTNKDAKTMSSMIYDIANGAGRGRLKNDGTPQPIKTWDTIVLASLNQNVYDILEQFRKNCDAEKFRVLQYHVPLLPGFGTLATKIDRVTSENYGHAGPTFVKYVVEHREELKGEIKVFYDRLAAHVASDGNTPERFMLAGLASIFVGAQHAYQLGLIGFDPVKFLLTWALRAVARCKNDILTEHRSPVSILSEFLNDTMGNRLAVAESVDGRGWSVVKPPVGALTQRLECGTGMLWVTKASTKAWCVEARIDFNRTVEDMVKSGAIVCSDARKTLGAGTLQFGGGPERCLQINLRALPELLGFAEVQPLS